VITLFSTDPVFGDGSLVALDDPQEFTPPQNVIPVVNRDVLDGNPDIADTLNAVSAAMTTEGLAALNGLAAEGQQPADIAADWLADNGLAD
jgi:osmoprotectant transport system substrate-binding protein